MKTYILVYEGYVNFEVTLSAYFMKTAGEIITAGIDKKNVTSWEGFLNAPHITLDQLNPEEADLFVIPGGDPKTLFDCQLLYSKLMELKSKNKSIAAICAAPVHLARAGVLKGLRYTTSLNLNEYECFEKENYREENVVVDGNVITAKPEGYVDFAIEIGRLMNIYRDDEDFNETINFFKYFNGN